MKNDDFDTYATSDDIRYSEVDNHNGSFKRLDKRRRLEDLLEEKRLSEELDDYDNYLSQKASYYEDDLFSEFYTHYQED